MKTYAKKYPVKHYGHGGKRPGSGRMARRFVVRDGDVLEVVLDSPDLDMERIGVYPASKGRAEVLRADAIAVVLKPGHWIVIRRPV